SQAGNGPPDFPIASKIQKDEPPVLQHIRDYSNYLLPHGPFDILQSAAIYFRGLAANALLVSPWLLLAAGFTVRLKPTKDSLSDGTVAGYALFPNHFFVASACFSLFLLVALLGWSLWRSAQRNVSRPEIPGFGTTAFAWSLVVLAALLFCEF